MVSFTRNPEEVFQSILNRIEEHCPKNKQYSFSSEVTYLKPLVDEMKGDLRDAARNGSPEARQALKKYQW